MCDRHGLTAQERGESPEGRYFTLRDEGNAVDDRVEVGLSILRDVFQDPDGVEFHRLDTGL